MLLYQRIWHCSQCFKYYKGKQLELCGNRLGEEGEGEGGFSLLLKHRRQEAALMLNCFSWSET